MNIKKTLDCLLGGVEDKLLLAEVMVHLFGSLESGQKVRRILGGEDEADLEDGPMRPILRTHRNTEDVALIVAALVVAGSDVGRYTAEEIETISEQRGHTESIEFLRGSVLGLLQGVSLWVGEVTGPDHEVFELAVVKTLNTLLFNDPRVDQPWSDAHSGTLSNTVALIVDKNPAFTQRFLSHVVKDTYEFLSDGEKDPGVTILDEFSWKFWKRLTPRERAKLATTPLLKA